MPSLVSNHRPNKISIINNICFFSILIVFNINATCLLATVAPTFDRPSENVSVVIGNAVVLPCYINNLGDHKVAWIKMANMDILAIGDYKVTNDDRIRLLHGYVSDWSLSIKPVTEEDAGTYICQVNTEPQIISKIRVNVQLPPKIIEERSLIRPEPVKEGDSLRLHCQAEGEPAPAITWFYHTRGGGHHHRGGKNGNKKRQRHHRRRITGKNENHNNSHNMTKHIFAEGDTLFIKNISRLHAGLFECIANNSVPPAASRQIRVVVEFAPEIHLKSHVVEQRLGSDTRLDCKIRANPLSNHYWMKDGKVIETAPSPSLQSRNGQSSKKTSRELTNNRKHQIHIYNQNNKEHLTVSALTIRNLTSEDFGRYECFAVNGIATTKAELLLKELVRNNQRQQQRYRFEDENGPGVLILNNLKNNAHEDPNDSASGKNYRNMLNDTRKWQQQQHQQHQNDENDYGLMSKAKSWVFGGSGDDDSSSSSNTPSRSSSPTVAVIVLVSLLFSSIIA